MGPTAPLTPCWPNPFQFIWPGCGYSGSCFHKDVQALVRTAQQAGYVPELLQAMEARRLYPAEVAAAMAICTERKRFMAPNVEQLGTALRQKLIFDGRNLYDPERLAEQGWTYYAIGRRASIQAVV